MGVGSRIFLGTVALEPNRWSLRDPSGAPLTDLAQWMPTIERAGFDGVELWDRHLPTDPAEADAMANGPVPIPIFSSYVSFDDPDPAARASDADRVAASGAEAVKFNVGNDPAAFVPYVERVRAWIDALPPRVAALCECHAGISIAEDPEVAARLFDAIDRPGRVHAIVHTHEPEDHLRARIAAYGDRISHVHVNYLDAATLTAPRLIDCQDDLASTISLLDAHGITTTWTIEFVRGVLTEFDEAGPLLAQAIEDLAVLRGLLAQERP